jgi:phosphotriesterase-related protein
MCKKVVTVRGLVDPAALGITLAHEHLLADFTCRYSAAADEAAIGDGLALSDRAALLRDPAGYRVNLLATDEAAALRECAWFAEAGGRTIVDLTPVGLSPDVAGLRRISEASDLNVIAATGFYIDASLPKWVDELSIDQLADRLVEEIETGGAEGIRRGAIGEIAVESGSEIELRCIRASGRAQARTGAPCFFHVMSGILPQFRDMTDELIALYRAEGGDVSRLVLCHQDGSGSDPAYQERLLSLGLWLEYDTFGSEGVFAFGETYIQLPTDSQRIAEVAALIDAGHIDRLLLSQDICYQTARRARGGWGMAHILTTLRPRFAAAGIDEAKLMRLLVDNPARLFAFA